MVQLNFNDFIVINLNYPINYQINMMMNLSFDRIKFTVWSFFVFISIVFIFFYYVILVDVFILDSIIFLHILHLDLIDFENQKIHFIWLLKMSYLFFILFLNQQNNIFHSNQYFDNFFLWPFFDEPNFLELNYSMFLIFIH